MTRTDRTVLLPLCLLAAPLLLTACNQRDTAAATEPAHEEMQEVVITASRTDTADVEEDHRTLPN